MEDSGLREEGRGEDLGHRIRRDQRAGSWHPAGEENQHLRKRNKRMGKSILPPSPANRRTRAVGPAEHEAGLPPTQRRKMAIKPREPESSSDEEGGDDHDDRAHIKVGADGQEFDQRDLTWDGPPVKKRPNGDTYYLAFRIAGVRCAIGEWVWLKGDVQDDGSNKKMLARIDNTWEDGAGVMWCELLWYRPTALMRLVRPV